MNGTTLPLWVDERGRPPDGATETFLLLHGYGGSSFSWRHWAPYLAARGHVLLVDLKGFGAAPRPDDDAYSPRDLADLVCRLAEERDLARVTLVGHSLGGGVALLATLGLMDRGQEGRVHRLVLVAGAAYPQPLPPFVTLARHPRLTGALLRLAGPRPVVAQALRAIVYDKSDISEAQIRGYAAPMATPGSARALLRTALQIVPEDLDEVTARYSSIAVPTLLLWGRHDPAVPLWVGRRLHRAIPGSTLRILERCGHLPAEERPRESLAALRDFLDANG